MNKLDAARYELIEKREELSEVDYVRLLDTVKDEAAKAGGIGGFVIGIVTTVLTLKTIEDLAELIVLLCR